MRARECDAPPAVGAHASTGVKLRCCCSDARFGARRPQPLGCGAAARRSPELSASPPPQPGLSRARRPGPLDGTPIADLVLAGARHRICNDVGTFVMHLAPGTRLGRYDIQSLLGAGGMGEVYLAHDTSLRRKVAIKVLPGDAARDRERLRRFEQEAHAASSLNHPNILTIYEIGVHDGTPFVATELVEGESLRQRMNREH